MKSNACIRPGYYRITIYSVAKLRTPDLFTLALMSYGRDVLDGRLCHELRNATGFRFFGTSLEGNRDVCLASGPIIRVEAPYVLARDGFFQILRVPTPIGSNPS